MNTFFIENEMVKSALEIVKKINNLGFDACLVGGCVRDIILNTDPKDVDIATNCPINILEDNFIVSADIGKNRDFGIILISYNDFTYEVAQFRTESEYVNGRHPSLVECCSTFEEDSSRRDFTINALGLDENGNVVDFHNGIEDINNKKIRTVGDPYLRFNEDYLRMIRCIRFASRFNFNIETETLNAIKECSSNIVNISAERITQELFKMAELDGDSFANSIICLDEVGLLDIILPEVTFLKKCPHGQQHHPEGPTVWEHVIAALRANKEVGNPILNIAVLLHDVGKGKTYKPRIDEFGVVKHSYHGHDNVGSDMIDAIAKRLKFSNDIKEIFKYTTANHMKFHNIIKMKPGKVHKLMESPYFELLVKVSYCDDACRLHAFNEEEWYMTIEKINSVKNRNVDNSLLSSINGKLLLELTDIEPGPEFGKLLSTLKEWVVDECVNECDLVIAKIIELQS